MVGSVGYQLNIITGWLFLTCFYHREKYESQWEGLSDILWKRKMFQTTNQLSLTGSTSITPAVIFIMWGLRL